MSKLIVAPTKFELTGILNSLPKVQARTSHKIAMVDRTKLIFFSVRKGREKLLSALFKKYNIEKTFILGTAGAISTENVSKGEVFYIKKVFKRGCPPRALPKLNSSSLRAANAYTSKVPIVLKKQREKIRNVFPVDLVDMETYNLVTLFEKVEETPYILRIVLDYCNTQTFRNWRERAKPLMKKLFSLWREHFL